MNRGIVGRLRDWCLIGVLCASVVSSQTLPAAAQKPQMQIYTCPMDADVKSKDPGNCPKCGMTLRAGDPDALPASGRGTAGVSSRQEGPVGKLKIPDATVYDQNGRRLHFYSDIVKGRTVAINFIFTTCTTVCPPLTVTFRRVQQTLTDRVGRDITLVSLSVDPTVDTPERLRNFAEKFKAGPGWIFVTGEKAEIDRLLEAFGAAVGNKNDHTPMVLVVNEPAGYWTRSYGLAPASTLAAAIAAAAGGGAAPTSTGH